MQQCQCDLECVYTNVLLNYSGEVNECAKLWANFAKQTLNTLFTTHAQKNRKLFSNPDSIVILGKQMR